MGIQLLGTDEINVADNLVIRAREAGLNLQNAHGSSVRFNTFCHNEAGVRYEASITPSAFDDFGPSSNNVIRSNLCIKSAPEVLVADPSLGPGNDAFGNTISHGRCPS